MKPIYKPTRKTMPKLTKNGTIAREAPEMFRIPKDKPKLKAAYDKACKKSSKTAVIIHSLEKSLMK